MSRRLVFLDLERSASGAYNSCLQYKASILTLQFFSASDLLPHRRRNLLLSSSPFSQPIPHFLRHWCSRRREAHQAGERRPSPFSPAQPNCSIRCVRLTAAPGKRSFPKGSWKVSTSQLAVVEPLVCMCMSCVPVFSQPSALINRQFQNVLTSKQIKGVNEELELSCNSSSKLSFSYMHTSLAH